MSNTNEKRVVDLAALTKDELLNEFADRVLAYEKSSLELAGINYLDHDLIMANDENFCLVRECVRFIKNDETLLQC